MRRRNPDAAKGHRRLPDHENEWAPHPANRRSLWTLPVLLACIAGVTAATYALPFTGFWLSLLLPTLLLPALMRTGRPWPNNPKGARAVWPWLAWAGLWAPALVDFFTPLLYNARIPVSTSWLIIPLCSPNTQAPVLIPAAAATAVCLTGMGVALLARRPWIWVLAMWLAPWAHQAVMSVVPSHFGC